MKRKTSFLLLVAGKILGAIMVTSLITISAANAITPSPELQAVHHAEISGQKFHDLPVNDPFLMQIKYNGQVVAIQTEIKLIEAYELTRLDFETFPKELIKQSRRILLIRIDNQPFDSITKHAEPFQEEMCVLPFGKCYVSKNPEIVRHPRLIRFEEPMKGYLQCYSFLERDINESCQLKLTDGQLSYTFNYNSVMAPNLEKLIKMSIALIDMMKL